MAKVGRPTDYKPEFCEQVAQLCANGATDQEVADFFGVTTMTIWRWRGIYPEFCDALRVGKDMCDDRVERSLFHRAVGFEHVAVKIFMPAGANKPVYAKYREYVVPDTGAATLWLKNRRPDKWRDKTETHLSGAVIVERVFYGKKHAPTEGSDTE